VDVKGSNKHNSNTIILLSQVFRMVFTPERVLNFVTGHTDRRSLKRKVEEMHSENLLRMKNGGEDEGTKEAANLSEPAGEVAEGTYFFYIL
jgi:hypothetical protein